MSPNVLYNQARVYHVVLLKSVRFSRLEALHCSLRLEMETSEVALFCPEKLVRNFSKMTKYL